MPDKENTDAEKFNLDVDHWNARKDQTLEKHGFPRHALKHTKVLAVFETDEKGVGDPDLCLIYNETGKLEDMLGYEPFKNEEEFEEVCRKTAGYYAEAHQNKIARLEETIKSYQKKIKAEIGRTWTYKPQECEGTYAFDGKGFLTKGINEDLAPEEIQLILASIHKRITEKKIEIRNRTAKAVGVDYLQVCEADDGTKVFAIDQLDHAMKESGEFKSEDDHWTLMLSHEY